MLLVEKIRRAKKIKIHELANLLEIDSSLMSRILSGKRKPTKEQLKKLSEVLDVEFRLIMKEFLADEVIKLITEYPIIASEVLKVAEERIAYLKSPNSIEVVELSPKLKLKLETLSELQKRWNFKKPLDQSQLKRMEEYFYTSYTYESNRIEGNTLTLQETHLVINEGITIGGKSMHEHLEAVNHKDAIHLMMDLVQNKISLNSYRLKQIHQLILKGINDRNAGKYRDVPVRISGCLHVPPEPYMIEKLMEDYFLFYEIERKNIHPVILAAEMHERLVTIHPFIDGNGRTARLVMNLILLQNGYTIANLKGSLEDRLNYYKALEKVQLNHDSEMFHELIVNHSIESLKEHLHLTGEINPI